ncbi:MAG: tyrosine-type recombinase/integrase [Actinobacteria bacterium]|nr:tyrosine-type recombinase/integrase [Actinomycetota bacterium]
MVRCGRRRRHPPHPQSASRKTHDRPAELVALKTDAAARDVELRPRAVRELGAHRRARFALGHAKQDDLVFATVDGKPLHFASVSGRLRRAAKRAGLGHVAFHDLRRTAASHLIRAGADPVRAARTLGHSNPAMTLDVYARDFAEAARDGELERKLNARGFGT